MKLQAFFLLALLLIPLSSAFEFDNVVEKMDKTKDAQIGDNLIKNNKLWDLYPPIQIKNAYGFGTTLSSGALESHTTICESSCESIFTLSISNPSVLVEDITFWTMDAAGTNRIAQQPIRKYALEIMTSKTPYLVEDTETNCQLSTNINGTKQEICSTKKKGTHTEYKYVWEPYTLGTTKPSGTYTIRLTGEKKNERSIDWVIKTQGKWIEEWSTWSGTSSLAGNITVFYDFDETGIGTNVLDRVSATNNGTFENGGNRTTGIVGLYSALLNGTNHRVLLNNANSKLDVTKNFTIQAWVNTTTVATDQAILDKSTGGTANYRLGIESSTLFFRQFNGGWITVASTPIVSNKTYHAVVTRNATGYYMFVNGALNATTISTTPPITTGGEVTYIGYSTVGAGMNWKGKIDEVGLWNRSLSSSEINQLYNNGIGMPYGFTSSIQLNNPIDNYATRNTTTTFDGTATVAGANITNISYWDNSTGTFARNKTNIVTGGTNTSYFNQTFPSQGSFLWGMEACDSDGACGYSTNRTLSIDTTKPNITITYPGNIVPYHKLSTNLNLNWTATDSSGMGTCQYQWNSINTTIACQLNTTNINITTATPRQAIFSGNDTLGNYQSTQQNWNYSIFENSRSFNINTTELSTENYGINITWDSNAYSSIVAGLVYNGTYYLASTSSSGTNLVYNRSLEVADVAGTTFKTFYWNFVLTNLTGSNSINTTTSQQQINNVSLDNCGSFTNTLVNYTVYDEDDRSKLNAPANNVSVDLYLSISTPAQTNTVNVSFNTTNVNGVRVCTQNVLSGTYRLDSTVKYSATNRATEYYNIQNNTLSNSSVPMEIALYDLLTTNAQEFQITYKDENFIPVSGALIEIAREYLPLGTFLTVEIPKTDSDGKTIANLYLNNVVYTIYVKKEGRLLATFNNVRAFCSNIATGQCTLELTATGSSGRPESFLNFRGVSYTNSYNATSRIYTLTYTSSDGSSKNVGLNVSAYNNYNNNTICTQSASSSSSTLQCSIPQSFGNGTGYAVGTVGNQVLFTDTFVISQRRSQILGGAIYFFAFLLIISLPLMFATTGQGALVGFMIGLVAAGGIAFVDLGGYFGASSAFAWFLIAIFILIYKISKGDSP